MSQVLEILTSLGIDGTFYYQFVIFCVAFIAMKYIAFGPYLAAYNERLRRTVGSQKEAQDMLNQADEAEAVFKEEAKKLNSEIRAIFNEANSKAKTEVEQILNSAKAEADAQIEEGRQALSQSVNEARQAMDSHLPEISEKIQTKFMGQ